MCMKQFLKACFFILVHSISIKWNNVKATDTGAVASNVQILHKLSKHEQELASEATMNDIEEASPRKIKLKATRTDTVHWPSGLVPYTKEDGFDSDPKRMSATQGAMEYIQKRTCIQFIKRTNESYYAVFNFKVPPNENRPAACGTVGYGIQKDGKTMIRLEHSGCFIGAVPVHEIMHALGFIHEHQRPDRDDYVVVLWKKLAKVESKRYQKVN